MLQQLYASDDEGAQIVTPGDSQGRAEATDSDSPPSVTEISEDMFAQTREKRNSGQRKARGYYPQCVTFTGRVYHTPDDSSTGNR